MASATVSQHPQNHDPETEAAEIHDKKKKALSFYDVLSRSCQDVNDNKHILLMPSWKDSPVLHVKKLSAKTRQVWAETNTNRRKSVWSHHFSYSLSLN